MHPNGLGICVVRLTTNFKIKYDTSLAYNIYTLLCAVKFNIMKPYFIYYFDVEEERPRIENGYEAYIEKAKNELDALKKWHAHLNGYYARENFFRNSTYHAVCAL